MCGIIGVVCREGAADRVLEGLKRLEYRGYDSAGISVLNKNEITTVKRGGRVEKLVGEAQGLKGGAAIGHTRWATHGAPTDENAHPHVCGRFSVVHNGIIENFRELKEELEARGEVFLSETDSEVIVKLISGYYRGDALAAVRAAVARLKGSFALGVLCADFDGIIAVKYRSPVVIGYSQQGTYVASDVPALPPCVTGVSIPEDGDIAVITVGNAAFYDFDGKPVNRVRSAISPVQTQADKGGYAHFMIKEIYEAERTVKETAEAFFRSVDLKKLTRYLKSADKIIITGCGTAYNAGKVALRFFAERSEAYLTAEIASELRYSLPPVTERTLVIAVTQSGETADTVEAVLALKEKGAKVVAVTNCGYSAITRVAHLVVPVCARAEICVAATKSYVGQLAALYLIAALYADPFAAQDRLLSACGRISTVLSCGGIEKVIAAECVKSSAVFFLGRGIDYDVAVEASLKLKEVSYIFCDGYPAGELKHGTLALIDEKTFAVFIICDGRTAEKCVNAAEQVLSRGGRIAVITSLDDVAERFAEIPVWKLPQSPAILSPFSSAIAVQRIAYEAAVMLSRDPDKPRNLAKSVTVE